MMNRDNPRCGSALNLSKGLPTEMALLIACVRAQMNGSCANTAELTSYLRKTIDWTLMLRMTVHNRVIPAVWRSLAPFERSLPQQASRRLTAAYSAITTHHASHIGELSRLSKLLREHNIPFMPLKGPALAKAYDHPAVREWGDLDILLRRSDVARFDSLLPLLGYRRDRQDGDCQLQSLLSSQHAYNIVKADGASCVDVHWQLSDETDEVRFPAERLWATCSEQDFFGSRVVLPDSENQLLYTCLHHGLRQGWAELRMIADWAVLLHTADHGTDWERLLASAKDLRIRRAFLTGTALVDLVCDYAIPGFLQQQIVADLGVRKAARQIFLGLFRVKDQNTGLVFCPFNRLYVTDDLRRTQWHILRRCLCPNPADKALVRLPSALHFMYYLIRPFRLAGKYGKLYLERAASKSNAY